MAGEVDIPEADLIGELGRVLAEVAGGTVFRVMDGGDCSFVLGPDAVCGRVFGLYDPEYGWPTPVQVTSIRSADDVRPRLRGHACLMDGDRTVAVVISADEYAAILRLPP